MFGSNFGTIVDEELRERCGFFFFLFFKCKNYNYF